MSRLRVHPSPDGWVLICGQVICNLSRQHFCRDIYRRCMARALVANAALAGKLSRLHGLESICALGSSIGRGLLRAMAYGATPVKCVVLAAVGSTLADASWCCPASTNLPVAPHHIGHAMPPRTRSSGRKKAQRPLCGL